MPNSYSKALPRDWRGLARVFTALGDEHRQRILLMFKKGEEVTLKSIVDQVPLSRTAVAHHIRALRECGVLQAQKRGKEIYLKPNAHLVLEAIEALRSYIKEEFSL